MVKEENIRAKLDLQEGLKKFKEDAMKKGWEEDEVQEKITEVFTNFPFYKFTSKPKTSWTSRVGKMFLYAFILYLAYCALLERNKRLQKTVNDYLHDHEFSYHQMRILRFLVLPVFKFYDLSKFHMNQCLIQNPFKSKGEVQCDLCENVEEIKTTNFDETTTQIIESYQPLVVQFVPGYNSGVRFKDFQVMFNENRKELDENICDIVSNDEFKSVSDYFKQSEEEVMERNMSIRWRNCHTYGTRFYRKLFPRPKFVPSESEISFEKTVMIMHKDSNVTIDTNNGDYTYLAQVEGKSAIQMTLPIDCDDSCKRKRIEATMQEGDIFVFPSAFWEVSIRSIQNEGLSIVYQSSYT